MNVTLSQYILRGRIDESFFNGSLLEHMATNVARMKRDATAGLLGQSFRVFLGRSLSAADRGRVKAAAVCLKEAAVSSPRWWEVRLQRA